MSVPAEETPYRGFASIYDVLMGDVPYAAWAERVSALIGTYGVSRPVVASNPARIKEAGPADEPELLRQERDLVVELGCGTGTLTGLLSDLGYDVVGIDRSPEMLAAAQAKNADRDRPIPYFCQDMRSLDLYCTAGTFVSVCDSVNYLLTDRDILRTFSGVNRFLFPGGIFVFDFNTTYKYREVIGNRTIAESGEEASFIWENRFRARGSRNRAELTLFAREADGRYRREIETHVQRGFTLPEIRRLLAEAGLSFIAAFDERSGKEPHGRNERILVVAREQGKDARV